MEVCNLYIVLAVTRSAATLAGNRKNVSINHPALYFQIDTSSMMHEPPRLTKYSLKFLVACSECTCIQAEGNATNTSMKHSHHSCGWK